MAPEPATDQSSIKTMYVLLLVAGAVALGLNLFNYIRKPSPWPEALLTPFLVGGLMLMAWAGLLPATKPGAQRALRVLSMVCIAIGLVLGALGLFRS
jgi:hypothetical protein